MNKVFIIILFFTPLIINAARPVKVLCPDSVLIIIDSLKKNMGINKQVDNNLQPAFYAALMYYNQLSGHKIKVKYGNIKTTMQCRPLICSVFRQKNKRGYKIIVDNKKILNNGVLFSDLLFNAQVGVFGHELAHIVDYSQKNNCQIIIFGIQYLFPLKRQAVEHKIDKIAIEHGLGFQVSDFAEYVFNSSNVDKKYRQYKKRFYYNPGQIHQIIFDTPLYSNFYVR